MLFAAAGQGACMAILAGTVAEGSKAAGVVAIVMLFLFNFFFAVGLLAIPWLRKLRFSTQIHFYREEKALTVQFSSCGIRSSRDPYPRRCTRDSVQLDLHLPCRRDHTY